ncbi:MAG TPA: hypothetical protein VH092_14060 [Urbifossiella sp.]|jgi:hypothetical protein|nr:hypothetical protein [Urbifossiella sp.]
MPGRIDDLPALPTLTLDQVAALLTRLKAGDLPPDDSVVVFAVRTRAHGSPGQPTTFVPCTESIEVNMPPTEGLERLGMVTALFIRQLMHFHLAACAYADGAASLQEVVREFKRRKNSLPPDIVPHPGTLSQWFRELESEVFGPFFQQDHFFLRVQPRGEGTGGILSPAGHRAWAVTRTYLARVNCLPGWPDGEERQQGVDTSRNQGHGSTWN